MERDRETERKREMGRCVEVFQRTEYISTVQWPFENLLGHLPCHEIRRRSIVHV